VATGAQVRLVATNSGFTVGAEALTLSGQGVTTGGALRNAAGDNTWQGNITLATNATIGAASGTSLTIDVSSGNAITAANFNLTFGTYANNATPSALLTLNNFIPGNSLTFSSTSFNAGQMTNYFAFGTGFVDYSLSNTGNTFTITAIPEPSTIIAAIGLLGVGDADATGKCSGAVPGAETRSDYSFLNCSRDHSSFTSASPAPNAGPRPVK
jgi:hypothetical protein